MAVAITMKVINEEPMWSPYPTAKTAHDAMRSMERDVSFFLGTCPGDMPNTDDEETTDVHMVNTRKANFATMGTVAITENTRLGPAVPMREFEDLISDGVPIIIGRAEPKLPVAPPSGSVRYGERESDRLDDGEYYSCRKP